MTDSPRATLRPERGASTTLSGGEPGGELHDGSTPPPAPAATVPETFDLLSEIGRGGMGIVYRATQESLARTVALKVLRPDLASDPRAASRFAVEALATGRLEHPAIPPVLLYGRDAAGRAYLPMKLVKGVSWAELLEPRTDEARRRAKDLDLRAHLDILKRVCEAVAYTHSRGSIHRDLKPENVMVGEFGEVLVMDWGIAKDLAAGALASVAPLAGPRRPVGTPAYMPPEMAACRDHELGPATDVYLLGGILYEILTGTPPHAGESVPLALLEAAEGKVEPPAARAPGKKIPEPLAELAMRELDPDPEKRPPSPMDLARALDDYERHESAVALADFAGAEIAAAREAIAARSAPPAEIYGRLAGAVAALKQADEIWPAQRATREALGRARVAYVSYALANGDLGVAEAQLENAGADAPGTAEARARLEALKAARAGEARRRRRLLAGLAAAAVLVVLAARLAWRQARRAGRAEAARLLREKAQAEIEGITWAGDDAKIAAYERALAIDPSWFEAQGELGRTLLDAAGSANEPDRARALLRLGVAALRRALELRPDDALAHSDLAYAALVSGDFEAAKPDYQRAAELAPGTVAGLEAAGLLALDEGCLEEAERRLGAAIALDPQKIFVFERAFARDARGEVDGALSDIEEARALQDEDDEWYVAPAVLVRLARGEMRRAGKEIRDALRTDWPAPHVLPLLAYRAALLGDRERARAVLEEVRRVHDAVHDVFLVKRPFYTAAARAPGRLGAAARAVLLEIDVDALAPAEPALSVKVRREGEALLEKGDPAGALAAATRALADDPVDGAALLLRGRALAALGHVEAARRDLEEAALFAPERAQEARAAREALGS